MAAETGFWVKVEASFSGEEVELMVVCLFCLCSPR